MSSRSFIGCRAARQRGVVAVRWEWNLRPSRHPDVPIQLHLPNISRRRQALDNNNQQHVVTTPARAWSGHHSHSVSLLCVVCVCGTFLSSHGAGPMPASQLVAMICVSFLAAVPQVNNFPNSNMSRHPDVPIRLRHLISHTSHLIAGSTRIYHYYCINPSTIASIRRRVSVPFTPTPVDTS